MKTLWDLLQEMYDRRWVRYLVAVLFPLFGILIGVRAFIGIQLQTVSGTIHTVEIRRDSQSGNYQEHLISLDGSTTHYTVKVTYFSPTLAQDALTVGQRVDLWYEDSRPFFDPDVDAIQIYDADGTPTKYVTGAYIDPVGTNRGNLITASIFILLGLLALASAIWLPVNGESGASRPSSNPASRPSYGEMVLAPIHRPGDASGR